MSCSKPNPINTPTGPHKAEMVTPTYTVVLLLLWREVSCGSETSCHLTARHGVQTWRTALFADANVALSCCSGEERRVPVKPGKNSTSMQRRVRDRTETSRFRVVLERSVLYQPGRHLGAGVLNLCQVVCMPHVANTTKVTQNMTTSRSTPALDPSRKLTTLLDLYVSSMLRAQ